MDFSPVERFAEVMRPVGVRWWVAAGWAVDLHVGRVTRAHSDLDVMVLQRDAAQIAARLPVLYAENAESGELIDWDRKRPLVPGPESLAMEEDLGWRVTKTQLLVGLAEKDEWIFHRGNGSVRMTFDALTRHSPSGLPYLAPEIVLLFKSRQLRDKDTRDFRALRGVLTAAERSWLRANLQQWRADHPWLGDLES